MNGEVNNKPKVVILGGGIAALSAAFELTSRTGWKDSFDVHVHQMGWRLGGKGASGRNANAHQRIEEHGLHVWPGFYDNAFHIMQRCYAELGRHPNTPLATWDQAFVPQNFIVVEEFIDGKWIHWPFDAPTNDSTPGDPGELPTIWDYVSMTLQLMSDWLSESGEPAATSEVSIDALPKLTWFGRSLRAVERLLRFVRLHSAADWLSNWRLNRLMKSLLPSALEETAQSLTLAQSLVQMVVGSMDKQSTLETELIAWLVDRFVKWFQDHHENEIRANDKMRRLFIQLDFARTAIRGSIADRVFARGFDAIDDEDFKVWLRRHGASDLTLESGLIRGLYDFVFASVDGNPRQPNLAAGVALRLVARMALTYKGAIMWEMKSGMGDVVFAPLYQVLKNRGVDFHFFHRVKSLELAPGNQRISEIKLARQATPKSNPGLPEQDQVYNPLIDVLGLPCWPNSPKFDALQEGAELQQRNIDLESAWTDWQDVEEITLTVRDQDQVVLGTSLAALPHICPQLINASAKWRHMLSKMRTVQTQAVQLWMSPTLAELGWTLQSPIMTAYEKPFETWADMTQTVPTEDWPPGLRPGSVAYYCGTLPEPDKIPEPGPSDFPEQQRASVRTLAINWLSRCIGHLWPQGTSPQSKGLDWSKLVDPTEATGVDRFESQYWRANVNPTDRYVLSVAGSTKYRLDPANSGFKNLFLAGDWTRNELNVGCIEAAVTSGLAAARGILGE